MLEAVTLSNDTVEKLAKDFVCLRLDPRENKILSSQMNVESIPDVRILLPDGKQLFQGGAGLKAPELHEAMKAALVRVGRSG